MRKAIGLRNLYIGIVVAYILLIAFVGVNIDPSYQETKTSDSITLIADDNNTFSDLSRNVTVQTGS